MAIKNSNGNYLRILPGSCLDLIQCEIYQSETARRNGLGEFEAKRQIGFAIPDGSYNGFATAEKSVLQNVLTAQYEALKADPQYANWEDC